MMTTVKPFCSNNAQGTNHPVIASSPFKRPAPLRASTSRTSRLPSIQEECPPYDSLRSTPSSEQREEFLDNQFSRSYTEESLEGETRHNSDDEELPPYVLLDNGANKPAYSRRQSEATSSTTSVVHQQQPYQSTKLDGILCPRCTLRRAKAWYRQIQKDREPGSNPKNKVKSKSKPKPRPKPNYQRPTHYTQADLDNSLSFAYYLF